MPGDISGRSAFAGPAITERIHRLVDWRRNRPDYGTKVAADGSCAYFNESASRSRLATTWSDRVCTRA